MTITDQTDIYKSASTLLCSMLGHCPDPRSVPREDKGDRHHQQGQESQKCGCPLCPQPLEHLGCKEGEASSKGRSTDGVSTEGRGCVGQVGVHDEVEEADEDEEEAQTQEGSGEHGRPVGDGRVGGPCEPEEGHHQ